MCSGWPSLTAVPVWDHLWPRRTTFFQPRVDHLLSVDHLFSTLYQHLGPPEIFGWWPPCTDVVCLVGVQRSAALGSTDGMVNSGTMRMNGEGAAQDLVEAHTIFMRGLPYGHLPCIFRAAVLEARGLQGIPRCHPKTLNP